MKSNQDIVEKLIILPLAYFGPIQLYSKFLLDGKHIIEQFDHYLKQTYRNRCVIYGANGPVILSIPVKRQRGIKSLVRDIRLDYDTDWKKMHWRSIISAYNSSAFFEFYRDMIELYYLKKYIFLADYAFDSTINILQSLNINPEIALSQEYLFPGNQEIHYDCRELITPKRNWDEDEIFYPYPYRQVFTDKSGFIPNLSIIDLLFNEGPGSKNVILLSLKTSQNTSGMQQKR